MPDFKKAFRTCLLLGIVRENSIVNAQWEMQFEPCDPIVKENSKITCLNKWGQTQCKLGCVNHYQRLRTNKDQTLKTKCFVRPNGNFWNKELFDCKTCKNLFPLSNNPNKNQFNMNCSLKNRAGFKLKKCNFRCKNRSQRIWYGQNGGTKQIKNAICGCYLKEDDGQCHWRQGKKTFDLPDSPNHFDNWYCSVNPTAAPTTTSIIIATTSTTFASATASATAPNDSSTTAAATPSPEPVKECGVPKDSITFSSKHQPISILSDDGSVLSRSATIPPEAKGPRIVNGDLAGEYDWPWQVGLREKKFNGVQYDHSFCGGSIISSRFVLTAAHCTEDTYVHKLYVTAGHLSRKNGPASTEPHYQIHAAEAFIDHPGYNGQTLKNDIALIKTATPFEWSDAVKPVCFPSQNTRPDDRINRQTFPSENSEQFNDPICAVTGYGTTGPNDPIENNNKLLHATVPVILQAECEKYYEKYGVFSSNICAGYVEGGTDSCSGDSGGPLVCYQGGTWVQLGIVSWGAGCAEAQSPGVYTRVTDFLDWINGHIENNP